jgi:hypothetical protein
MFQFLQVVGRLLLWMVKQPAVGGFLIGAVVAAFYVLVKYRILSKPQKYVRDKHQVKEPLVSLAVPKSE